ncbi:MAG: hypothetical protein IT159_09345 [Bryobacterales bacterium]|nr:hypothetical protein [Bryobacterales bacterium]
MQLATESAVRDATIQSKQVTDMPVQGRNWVTMLRIIPGAMAANTQGVVGREAGYDGLVDFTVNGKTGSTAQMNLDGGTNIDHGADGKTTVTASLESIQEISVLANNFQAQYGTRQGVVINVTTKSGTNQWHGTAWDYLRNEALTANPASNNMQNIPRPRYRYNYFGGNLGGPIIKDRLFIFVNHETLRLNNTMNSTLSRVPTELERKGDFSQTLMANGQKPVIYSPGSQAAGSPQPIPGNILPDNLLSPVGKALANVYPAPNFPNDLTNNYRLVGEAYDKRWLNVGRMDWNISPNHRAFLRFTYDYQHRRTPSAMPFTWTASWDRPDRALSANVTSTLSPTLVVENLFSWQLDFVHAGMFLWPDRNMVNTKALGLSDLPLVYPVQNQYLTDPGFQFLPEIRNTGFYNWSFTRFPWFAKAPEYQWASTWSWLKGTHVVKAGVQVIVNKKNEWDNNNSKGVFDFGVNTASPFDTGYNQANMLTGAINQFLQTGNAAVKYSMYQDVHFFLQDTWKIMPKLTLDYGVRFYHVPGERDTRPDITKDAAFNAGLWDPKKAPRFYIPDPTNTKQLIDPANPGSPLPASVFNALLYSIVPGSGDVMNGVVALNGKSGLGDPGFFLLGPRGGFAWQALNKTVVRGGFGISYGRPSITQAINIFENGLAEQIDYRMTSFTTLKTSTVRRISPRDFGASDPSTKQPPRVYDISLSVQRDLPGGWLVDVGYVGNLQQHQYIQFNLNAIPPGVSHLAQFVDSRIAGNNFAGTVTASNPGPLPGTRNVDSNLMRPYLGMGALNAATTVGNNRYSSLQVTATKRYSHGLSVQAVYTLGKLISGTQGVGNFYSNWKRYTGYTADNDRAQTMTLNYTYEVPSLARVLGWQGNAAARRIFDGWGLAHILSFMSGRAQTPGFALQYAGSTQAVANLNSIFTGSPDIAARIVPMRNPNTNVDRYHQFDTTAFTLPLLGTDGTGSRNYYYAPGTSSNDITVTKQVPIRERYGIELRASIFNLFNSARYQDVYTSLNYKMNGQGYYSGWSLLNTPETLVSTLLKSNPNATALAQYNQYRTGVGSTNMGSVLDPRRVELALRFKF